MKGEFSRACIAFYHLDLKLEEEEQLFRAMMENAQPYNGQTNTIELDRFMRYNRKAQALRAQANETSEVLAEVNQQLVKMMEYFGIPPYTRLTCEIAFEAEIEIWVDEDAQINYEKIRDLVPDQNTNGNKIMSIKMVMNPKEPEREDEDDDDDWDED